MNNLNGKYSMAYKVSIYICICVMAISSFQFINMKKSIFSHETVVAQRQEKNSNDFLKKDILPLSSQASLFNPEGLYNQSLIHLDQQPYQDFRSHPGIGMNYWNTLRDARQEILEKASEMKRDDIGSSLIKLEPYLNDYLLLIEIGEDKYEKIVVEESEHLTLENDGTNWASDYTYIKDFLNLQRVWIFYIQNFFKGNVAQLHKNNSNSEIKMYVDTELYSLSKIDSVNKYFFEQENLLNE